MGKHGQLVIGPAGSGKTKYCQEIQRHCQTVKRNVHIVNLDPAAEQVNYTPTIDIRELITVEDVMDELDFGPNGALVYCMEFLMENLDWLEDQLGDHDDDYLLFDCPGQLELYVHLPVMKDLVKCLERWGYRVCCVYLIDSTFVDEASKFLSASLMALSTMVQLELPHVNVLSKMDLLGKRGKSRALEKFFDVDTELLGNELNEEMGENFLRLNHGFCQLLSDYNMVNVFPLNLTKPDSIATVLYQIDQAIQFGEDLEPTEPPIEDVDDAPDFDEQGDFMDGQE